MKVTVGCSMHWKDARKRIALYCKVEMLLKQAGGSSNFSPNSQHLQLNKNKIPGLTDENISRAHHPTSQHQPHSVPAASSLPPVPHVVAAARAEPESSQHRSGSGVSRVGA